MRLFRRLRVATNDQSGFTLVELVITLVLMTLVTGAVSSAFVTAINSSETANQRVRESNDAQIIAAYLTRDAQAAGGTNPSTGTGDPSLGVSLTDDAGCTNPTGVLVIRFRWLDRSAPTTSTTRVADYYYDSSAKQLVRRTCHDGALEAVLTLGSWVASATASCSPADCTALPTAVSLQLTATNTPVNSATPYSYTLTASVRPESETAPSLSTSELVPLLALGGGSGCSAGATGLSLHGTPGARVYGGVIVNTTDSGSCNAMSASGAVDFISGPTSILDGGTCTGGVCPSPITGYSTPLSDPFAGLTPPAGSCAGGTHPAPTGSNPTHYHPGVYTAALSLSSNTVFEPGTYVWCNGLTITGGTITGSGVFFYVAGGAMALSGNSTTTLSPPTSGDYAGLSIWQAKTDTNTWSTQGGAAVDLEGTLYVPGAEVSLAGTADSSYLAIVAQTISIAGTHTITAGTPPAVGLSVSGPAALPTWTRSHPYPSTTVTATGGSGAGYTWSASGLPAGLTIGALTGTIGGTPSASGAFTVVVTVSDSIGDVASHTYALTINAAPVISAPASLASWTVGRPYPSTSVSAAGGTAPLTWSATGLPNGLTINSSTGAVTGTPTSAGTFTPTVTVSDTVGASASRTYTTAVNPAPAITTTALPAATQGVAYSTTVAASGGTAPLVWSATSLPTGLSIGPASGTISGTPTAPGSTTVTVTATDNAGATATKSFALTIGSVPLTVTDVSVANGGTAGTIDKGDTVAVVFNKAIAESTMCTAWSGSGDQAISGNKDIVVTITNNNGTTGNDTLTVSSTSCPSLRFGTLDLGTPNWVTATRTFSGSGKNHSSLSYTASTFTLSVSLGSSSGATATGVAAQTVAYTPNPAVTDPFGNAVTPGPYAFAGRRF